MNFQNSASPKLISLPIWWVVIALFFCRQKGFSQSVGVVLSGGGATATAHVGFLKVLEENDIPIDYISGTSMGAVIAALYASGCSVAQIDSLVRTEEFLQMATGDIDNKYRFYFKHSDKDAGMVNLRFSKGNFISNVLPTNLIDPGLLDWNLMELLTQADHASGDNFDSLYIPFRCIAADIHDKHQVIFREGPLNVAVRASCTYPFYLPPRRVNGNLLYDGGIYNNFPSDVMFYEFLPDVILGCNVSSAVSEPTENDLFSQLQSMIISREKTVKYCDEMIVVEPQLDNVGTFDFSKMSDAIQLGYQATLDSLQHIKQVIERRVSLTEKNKKRAIFREKFKPFVVDNVEIQGLQIAQNNYIKKMLGRDKILSSISDLKMPYFRVRDDDKIRSIFPIARYNSQTGRYSMLVDIQKERDLLVSFGGNFSSRSINTGFVGLSYNIFGRASSTISANSYFGRFYGSVSGKIRLDKSGSFPLSVQAGVTFNRWDYFRSLATFFDDVKPSYILLNERFGNLSLSTSAGNKAMIRTDFIYSHFYDSYYQTQNFVASDTADQTVFDAIIARATYERNTLNKKQYANQGTLLSISFKTVAGTERSLSGSTSILKDTTILNHTWYTGKISYTNYFKKIGMIKLGFMIEGVASTQTFFQNYIASVITAPSFNPIIESKTLFMPQFRAYNYASSGIIAVLSLTKNIDIRAEGYIFNPIGRIIQDASGEAAIDWTSTQYFMESSSIVLHSPFGPVSFSVNYFDKQPKPWSFLFNFGYVIFNRSARD